MINSQLPFGNINGMSISIDRLEKSFYPNLPLFTLEHFSIPSNHCVGIKGCNGSGKSTLLKILAGALSPSSGTINRTIDNTNVQNDQLHTTIGYAAPYINLYPELNFNELTTIWSKIRNRPLNQTVFNFLSTTLQINSYISKKIQSLSTGMRFRLQIVLAFMHSPSIVFLDEPTANFDINGFTGLELIVRSYFLSGGTVVLASNNDNELSWCSQFIEL